MPDLNEVWRRWELEVKQKRLDALRRNPPPANLRGRRKIGPARPARPQAPAPWQR